MAAPTSNVRSILIKLKENLGTACGQISGDNPTLNENTFDKGKFWKNFVAATKLLSHEATKFCMLFSKPPLPSAEETQKISDKVECTCFQFVAVFFTLPKSRGRELYKEIQNYVLSVLNGFVELSSAAANQSSSQLQTVGSVWEKCEAVENLPKDNRDAVVALCRGEYEVVQDACQELIDAMESEEDSTEDFFVPRVNGLNVPHASWTESDRHVLLPCSGLIKAAKACLKKTLLAVSDRGNGEDERCIRELDDLGDIIKRSSSYVDDMVLSLYPPMDHSAVRDQAYQVRNHCKSLLSCVKNCHFFTNADNEWVNFLEKAVDHNWARINDMVLVD